MKKILIRLFVSVLVFSMIAVSGAEETPPKITPLQLSVWNPVQLAPDDWDVWGLRLNMLYGMNRDLYGLDVGVFNLVRRDFAGIQAGIANLTGTESGRAFTGIQMGVANFVTLSGTRSSVARGLQLGFVNGGDKMSGLQAGFLNLALSELKGLQIGSLNDAESLVGIQIGFLINSSRETMAGVQVGFVNWGGMDPDIIRLMESHNPTMATFAKNMPSGECCGLQVGLVSAVYSSMCGVQIGLGNYAAEMHGLQFSIVNIASTMTGVQIGLVNIIKESPVAFFPVVNAHF